MDVREGATVAETADRDANHALRARFDDVYGQYQRLRSGMDELQRTLSELRATVHSNDGLIRATVGPRGQLIDLHLEPGIYREMDPEELADTIVAVTAAAAAKASAEVERLVAELLPAGAGAMQFLKDNDFGALLSRQDEIMRPSSTAASRPAGTTSPPAGPPVPPAGTPVPPAGPSFPSGGSPVPPAGLSAAYSAGSSTSPVAGPSGGPGAGPGFGSGAGPGFGPGAGAGFGPGFGPGAGHGARFQERADG
jgi:DNA-binding protein YbaB